MAVALGSHYHFNIRDGFGSFCTEASVLIASLNGFKNVGGKKQAELIFDASPEANNSPSNLCVSTGVFLETGTRYRVVVRRLPEAETVPPSGKSTTPTMSCPINPRRLPKSLRQNATASCFVYEQARAGAVGI
jgi:hypothetical protein